MSKYNVARVWPYFSENISKSYLSVSLIRKYIFTALAISLGQQDGLDAVILLLILQFYYLVYLCLVRPFRSNIDNIIEICLESIYFIILNLILIDVQSSKWLSWEKALPSILLAICICKCFDTSNIPDLLIKLKKYYIKIWNLSTYFYQNNTLTININVIWVLLDGKIRFGLKSNKIYRYNLSISKFIP